MITTVTQKNMVTIPAEVTRRFGIKPRWKLDWQPVEEKDEIVVRVIRATVEETLVCETLNGRGILLSIANSAFASQVARRTFVDFMRC